MRYAIFAIRYLACRHLTLLPLSRFRLLFFFRDLQAADSCHSNISVVSQPLIAKSLVRRVFLLSTAALKTLLADPVSTPA